MNNDIYSQIKSNLLSVENKLKNELIRVNIIKQLESVDKYTSFQASIKTYLDNFNLLKNANDNLITEINNNLKSFIVSTRRTSSISVDIITIVDNMNFLIAQTPKEEKKKEISSDAIITKEEFSNRYDKLISKLKSFDKECNLILETKAEQAHFKVYKNTNSTIAVVSGEEKTRLSFPKEQLIDVVYNDKVIDYHTPYRSVLIEKILDNSIFDLLIINDATYHDLDKINKLEEDRLISAGKLSDLEDKFNSRQEDFDNLQMILNQASTVKKDFKDAKNAVLEDLKVKISYTYWEEQATSYGYKYIAYLVLSIVLSIALLFGVFNFLKDNPLSVTSIHSYAKTSQQTQDQNKTTSVQPILNDKSSEVKVSKVAKYIMQSAELWEYAFLILFTTMGIWFIRIMIKITLSNYHLSVDANERVIMLKTYLSLIKDGNGYDENDKKVILDNIFRPTNFGIIKDETSLTIADVISSFKK